MNLTGKITTILANFYYVQDLNDKVWECFARGRLIKEGKHLFVGDNVDIEISSDTQGVIVDLHDRKNKIDKPPVANIDQVLVVFSTLNPEFDLYNLDRYLSFISYELPSEEITICLNKIDLKEIDLTKIYKRSGYDVINVSALTNLGLDDLSKKLANKTTVLTGPSGVGKSSLIKALKPELKIKIGDISSINRGKQTTRNVQLIPVHFNDQVGYLVDTPGFSQFDFSGLNSQKILNTFKELSNINCSYDNCLHINEEGCLFIDENIYDSVPRSRHENYMKIVEECSSEVVYGSKQESKSKVVGGKGENKFRPKIELEKRSKSRKKEKQELLKFEKEKNDEY